MSAVATARCKKRLRGDAVDFANSVKKRCDDEVRNAVALADAGVSVPSHASCILLESVIYPKQSSTDCLLKSVHSLLSRHHDAVPGSPVSERFHLGMDKTDFISAPLLIHRLWR